MKRTWVGNCSVLLVASTTTMLVLVLGAAVACQDANAPQTPTRLDSVSVATAHFPLVTGDLVAAIETWVYASIPRDSDDAATTCAGLVDASSSTLFAELVRTRDTAERPADFEVRRVDIAEHTFGNYTRSGQYSMVVVGSPRAVDHDAPKVDRLAEIEGLVTVMGCQEVDFVFGENVSLRMEIFAAGLR